MNDNEKAQAWLSDWTEERKVEWFAVNVMGRKIDDLQYACSKDGAGNITSKSYYWDPLRNYDHTHDLIAAWSDKEPEIHMRLWGEWMVWTEGQAVCVEHADFREAVCRACFISLA